MSKTKQGILGGFSGSIGNVVGSSWKGVNYMRIKPVSVANPNTAAQQEQRGKFRNCSAFAQSILTTIIQPYWNRIANKMSGFNYWVKTNIANFDTTGLQAPDTLQTTIGNINPPHSVSCTLNSGSKTVHLTWTSNAGEGQAQATDIALCVIHNETTGITEGFTLTATRGDEDANFDATQTFAANDHVHIWLSFKDAFERTGVPVYALVIV